MIILLIILDIIIITIGSTILTKFEKGGWMLVNIGTLIIFCLIIALIGCTIGLCNETDPSLIDNWRRLIYFGR